MLFPLSFVRYFLLFVLLLLLLLLCLSLHITYILLFYVYIKQENDTRYIIVAIIISYFIVNLYTHTIFFSTISLLICLHHLFDCTVLFCVLCSKCCYVRIYSILFIYHFYVNNILKLNLNYLDNLYLMVRI